MELEWQQGIEPYLERYSSIHHCPAARRDVKFVPAPPSVGKKAAPKRSRKGGQDVA